MFGPVRLSPGRFVFKTKSYLVCRIYSKRFISVSTESLPQSQVTN